MKYLTTSERLTAPVSIVRGVNPKILSITTLGDVLEDIKKQDTLLPDQLSKAYERDPPQYERLKGSLHGFIPGAFTARGANFCTQYIPLIVLDIDSIGNEVQARFLFSEVCKIDYTFACFVSPSGHGLRILVWCDHTDRTEHEAAHIAITEHYSQCLNIKTDIQLRKEQGKKKVEGEHLDTSAKAFPRFWYYTFNDEYLYVNESAKSFHLQAANVVPGPPAPPSVTVENNHVSEELTLKDEIIVECIEAMLKARNVPSGRNNFVLHFAQLANEHGLDHDIIYTYCLGFEEPDFKSSEIVKTVESAIKRTQRKYSDKQILSYYRKLKGIPPSVNLSMSVNNTVTVAPKVVSQSYHSEKATKIDYKARSVHEPKKSENKFNVLTMYLQKRYDFRYNEVANEIEISFKGQHKFETLNTNGLECELLEYGLSNVEKLLKSYLGNENYCPKHDVFIEYFTTLPAWDGVDHIAALADYVKTSDDAWWHQMFRKALMRTAACAMLKMRNKQCLTLFGGQNAGKSHFIFFLVPPQLKPYYKEGFSNPQSKDGKLEMVQNIVINLDDLDSLSKWEVGQIKALFTTPAIKERPFFGTSPRIFQRRASFWASTNRDDFLVDETGNVRWVIIKVKTILHDNGGSKGYQQNVDITKLWSQVIHLINSGEKYELTSEEFKESETHNKGFVKISREQEMIVKYFERNPSDDAFMTASEIGQALKRVTGSSMEFNIVAIGKAMSFLGIEKVTDRNKRFDYPVKGYHIQLLPQYQSPLDNPLSNVVFSDLPPPLTKGVSLEPVVNGEDVAF